MYTVLFWPFLSFTDLHFRPKLTKGHGIGGGPKTRFWSTGLKNQRKALFLLDFLDFFWRLEGVIVTKVIMGFETAKSPVITRVLRLYCYSKHRVVHPLVTSKAKKWQVGRCAKKWGGASPPYSSRYANENYRQFSLCLSSSYRLVAQQSLFLR